MGTSKKYAILSISTIVIAFMFIMIGRQLATENELVSVFDKASSATKIACSDYAGKSPQLRDPSLPKSITSIYQECIINSNDLQYIAAVHKLANEKPTQTAKP